MLPFLYFTLNFADNDKPTNPDPHYDPISMKELQNLSSWVHHKPNLLKQGRIKWYDENLLEEVYSWKKFGISKAITIF